MTEALDFTPSGGVVDDDVESLNPRGEEDFLITLLLSASGRALRDDALDTVDPDEFWSGTHGVLWKQARALRDAGRMVSPRTLEPNASGRALLTRLATAVVEPGLYRQAVATVKGCAAQRAALRVLVEARQRVLRSTDPATAIGSAMSELARLDTGDPSVGVRMADLLDRFVADVTSTGPRRTYPTPWVAVNDEVSGGLEPGRFYVVGARPGNGKSIAAHNIAEHSASQGFESLVFSMEMGDLEVAGRLVASGAQVELTEINRRALSDWSLNRMYEYVSRARDYSLTVVDKPGLDMGFVWSFCRQHKRRYGLDVVALDYLQLVQSRDSKVPQHLHIAWVSQQCKQLARELECAVVAPAQLNREFDKRQGGRPTKADLRDSGGIEAAADVVMLLARGVFTEGEQKDQFNGLLNVYIDKNRQGRECHLELPWRAHYATIG